MTKHPINSWERLVEYFWERIDKNGPIPERYPELGPCWIYTGGRDDDNYGRIHARHLGLQIRTNRLCWIIRHGSIPSHLHACHKCDNPPCSNPDHLFLGTDSDNFRDMSIKGRHAKPKGELHGGAKLDDKTVLEIRRLWDNKEMNQMQLASHFTITQPMISLIVRRKKWTHI